MENRLSARSTQQEESCHINTHVHTCKHSARTSLPVTHAGNPLACSVVRTKETQHTYLLVDGGRSSLGHRFGLVFAEHLVFAKHRALCFIGIM